MSIDISKYGTPIEDDTGFYNKTDVSKYGTPATQVKTQTKVGEKGLKGFSVGFGKSLLSGAIGTASLLQGAGQRLIAGATGQKYADVKAKTGFSSLKGEKKQKLDELLKREGKAEKWGGAIETIAEIAIPTKIGTTAINKANTIKYLKNTPETLSKVEEKIASLSGRIKTSISGVKKVLPSETEKRAAKILEGKISSNVVKNPPIIQKEITKRGAEAEKYLAKNKLPITAQEQANAFNIEKAKIGKYLDKNQLKSFEEQWKMFTKLLPGKGGYNTENFYKAVKEYEENIASMLPRGKEALLDPTGVASAKIQGAKTVRKIVRDLIGSKHPEFKPQMFDLASLYDVLDTAITKSRQLKGSAISRLMKKNPTLTNIAKIGGGILVGKTLLGGKKETTLSNVNQAGGD